MSIHFNKIKIRLTSKIRKPDQISQTIVGIPGRNGRRCFCSLASYAYALNGLMRPSNLPTSVPPSVHPSVCPSLPPSINPFLSPSACPSVRPSVRTSDCPSVRPFLPSSLRSLYLI